MYCCLSLLHFIKIFPGMRRACSVNLYRIKHTVFLNKSVKNSYTTFTDISLYLYCNWVNDVTWFQTKWIISRLIKHGNKFFKRSYFTVLRVLLFETTTILMTLPFIVSVLEKQALFGNLNIIMRGKIPKPPMLKPKRFGTINAHFGIVRGFKCNRFTREKCRFGMLG